MALRLDRTRYASDVATDLAQIAAVDYVVVTTGRYHVMVEVMFADLPDLAATVERDIMAVPGIADRELFPYLRLYYQEPRWEAARWKSSDRSGLSQARELSDMDRQVLTELNADGRVSFQVVAPKLGASESQIRHRVNRMVSSGTVRILGITNPRSVGFNTIAWLGIVCAPGVRAEHLGSQIAALPSITYVVICTGRFEILAEAICIDFQDLSLVLDEQLRALDGVARVEAFVALDLRYKRVPATQS
jgi:DNA-binding Lrp family transcriptional regulator